MNEMKFDYILETYEQDSHHFDHKVFTYAEVFNGTAVMEIERWARIGYAVIAKRTSTGLKDKNEVDIFEGDILKYYAENYHIGSFAVRWNDRGFWDYGIDYESSEVVGNIYENPELLKRG